MDASGHVGVEYCGHATGCDTSSKNAHEEVDELYVSLAEDFLGEA